MARPHLPRIYLCSSEWLGLLLNEAGARDVQALLSLASTSYDVVGSELLYVEVLAPGSEALLASGVRTWAAMDHVVAMKVRSFRQQAIASRRSIARMTPDLIHIATAAVAGVDAFITSDSRCRELASHFGLSAFDRGEFPPPAPGQLPYPNLP